MLLAGPPVAKASPLVLLTLLLVLALSSAVFWVLTWRSTAHRRWVALNEWAREAGFKVRSAASWEPPAPFAQLSDPKPAAQLCLSDGRTTLAQLRGELTRRGAAVHAADADEAIPPSEAPGAVTWHVLVRRIESEWKPTGLRPAHAQSSVLDLFSLSSFPLLGNIERFVVYGTDSAAAQALSLSSARALLPPDVGLLLDGHHLILDFSDRPFDEVEFNRMCAVADQIVAHLPTA